MFLYIIISSSSRSVFTLMKCTTSCREI